MAKIEGNMVTLKCPLCCRAEFPTKTELQLHLLDVLEALKCPACNKNYQTILGLVQHLSLSSCNVDVGVNFDDHLVTYVDCSFMKQYKNNAGNRASTSNNSTDTESGSRLVNNIATKRIFPRATPQVQTVTIETSLPSSTSSDGTEYIITGDSTSDNQIFLTSESGEIICINLDSAAAEGQESQENKVERPGQVNHR